MSKIFNRPVQLGGDVRKVGATNVRVRTYDENGDALLCSGTSVPTGAGYAKGCLFIKTDAATGTKGLYENQGTNTSASFNVVGDVTASEIALAEGNLLVGNSSGVGVALDIGATDAGIAVGNGTTATIVALSGAVTMTNAGVVSMNWGTSGTPLAHTANTDEVFDVHATNSGTSGNYEPINTNITVSAAGMTGGRVKHALTINDAMGAWSNALKAQVTYGASGSTTGLGSAFVAEMSLSAGTTAGTYAPLEVELNVGSGASLGTKTSMAYFSVQGADVANFDTSGYLFSINGLTAASGKLFQANTAAAATHALRIDIGGTDYYIMLTDQAA